jgi:ParB/RepB/Spo0J family partition protein
MKVSITTLKHHPLNKHIYGLNDIQDLSQNIKEVGLLQPLVVDQNNQIISGNRRFEAIKKLKWKQVPVIRTIIKPVDVPLLLISYNKQRVKSVQEIVNEINTLKKYYLKGQGYRSDKNTSANIGRGTTRETISNEIGISSGNFQKIMLISKYDKSIISLIDKGILTINQAYLQIQRIIKEKKSVSTSKDLLKDFKYENNIKIYKKSSHNMNEVCNEEVQTIFTSPPYWNKRVYKKGGGLGNEKNPEQYVIKLTNHLKDCYRVLNKQGSFFLNLGDTYIDGDLQNIPHRVVIELKKQGWILRNTIIWKKTNPKPSSSKSNLTSTYEYIFHLVKNKNYKYNLLLTQFSNKSKASLPPRHRSLNEKVIGPISPYIPREGKNIGDFWTEDIVQTAVSNQNIKNLDKKEHPAPFPKDIVILPILQTSDFGDLILDPFCGTGTVGIVSKSLNRKFIGYDIK